MIGPQWQTITRENTGAGVIALDPNGRVLQTNPAGQTYLDLLWDAGIEDIDDFLASMKEDSPEGQGNIPEATALNYELFLEGPPCRILQVRPHSVTANSRLEGWIVTIREVTAEADEQEETGSNCQRGGSSTSVFHWPPASPATSNLP